MTATENRTDISIRTDDGVVLRGWLLAARGATSPAPLILLHNGFGGVKEGHLEKFGRAFAQAGFNVLGYDPRGLGDSGGRVRYEIDPVQYVADFRDAITFGISLPGVDARRIGVWGSSYGGGIVIQAAALDARISCVAAQVPFLSGGAIWRSLPAEAKAGLTGLFAGERASRAAGQPVMTMKVVSRNPQHEPCILTSPESYDWCIRSRRRAELAQRGHRPQPGDDLRLRADDLHRGSGAAAAFDRRGRERRPDAVRRIARRLHGRRRAEGVRIAAVRAFRSV